MKFQRNKDIKKALNIGVSIAYERHMDNLKYNPISPYEKLQAVTTSRNLAILQYYIKKEKIDISMLRYRDNRILEECSFFGAEDIVLYLLKLGVIPDDLMDMEFRWKKSNTTYMDLDYNNPSPTHLTNTLLHFRSHAEFFNMIKIVECIDKYYNDFKLKEKDDMEFRRGGSPKYKIGIGNQYEEYKKSMIKYGTAYGFDIFLENEYFHDEGKEVKLNFWYKKLHYPMSFMLSQRNGSKPFISLLYNEGVQLSLDQDVTLDHLHDKKWWIKYSGVDPLKKSLFDKIKIKFKTLWLF